ncbi:MAG TPA: polysaccharide deacetylase family protein [Afifellaceae bacterium]|nr:polysaccharide deacetylase family protein [Afifellaceae bacterium]
MKQPLAPVVDELQRWRDQGLTLPLWWRDDDAIAPTQALDRLLALAESFDAPLHLAVVPRPAEDALAEGVGDAAQVFAIPHGWQHGNHAPAGEKKAEFGAHRPIEVMLDEVARGWRRIEGMFGSRAVPIFVPPWNRVCPAVIEGLAGVGLAAVSTFLPREAKYPSPGLLQVNSHLDPIAWRAGGDLADPDALAADIVAQLTDRRDGPVDNSEPFGLLTHHLAHDERVWSFVEAFVEVVVESGVANWTSPLDG